MARLAINIVENFDQKKYAVSFVGVNIDKSFTDQLPEGICVVSLQNRYIPGVFLKIAVYLIKEKPDIFISNAPHVSAISMMAKVFSLSRTKMIIIEHNNFSLLVANIKSFHRRWIGTFVLPHVMRIFYPLADAIICVSRGVAEDLARFIGSSDNINIIYNLVTNNNLHALSEEPVNHPWFLNTEIPVILAAGRLVKQKDYPTLLKAFALVCQKKPARLVILGEGQERVELEKLTHTLGISSHVVFLGFVKNQYQYMKRASVFVLSSIHEGFGNVIVEAMACGTPTVATDCKSGPNEIIENGKSGLLVPVANYQALSEAIVKVLDNSSLRQTLSLEGRKRATYFSFEKGAKKYQEVFRRVMEKSSAA